MVAHQIANSVRVGLVDGQDLVRLGLRSLVERESGLILTRECVTGDEALRQIPGHADVVVMADTLPDISGIALCRELRARSPLHVIMLANHWSRTELQDALRAGVSACFPIDTRAESIIEGIHTAELGGLMVGMGGFERVVRGIGPDDPVDSLTPSERRVLALVAKGMTNRQIGSQLYLSEKTVKNYVSRILDKMGYARRTEAASHFTRYEFVNHDRG